MHFMSDLGIDLISMIHYLQSQTLTHEEMSWVRSLNIQQIVELASQKGYHLVGSDLINSEPMQLK